MEDKAEPPSGEELKSTIGFCNDYYLNLLGYKPEQTSLQQIPNSDWNKFTKQRELNPNSQGIYLPRDQTAIIKGNNFFALFHEYFGHGLFCEQSLIGKKLVSLEKRLLEEEKEEFNGKGFTLEELEEFRGNNKIFQELEKFKEQNLGQYELFAIWTEYNLGKLNGFNLREDFGRRYEESSLDDKHLIDSVISFSKQYGNLATFYVFGLRKMQDKKRLLKLSEDIFGKNLERAPLVLHFGSGKDFSDIDLFVISDDIEPIYDYWIDVRAYSIGGVERGIEVLDSMITDPIMIGSLISGNRGYFNELKQKIIDQPITEDAIRFNLREYENEMRRAKDESLGEHLQEKNLRSAKTYLTNALALRNGKKVLTFNRLVDYSHVLSQSEKFIELKGGIG